MRKYILALSLLFLSFPALAAVTANSVVTAQLPKNGAVQFTSSTTPGTYATLYTAGSNGSKISAIYVSHDDGTATHIITCGKFNSGTQYESWTVTTAVSGAGLYLNQAMFTTWLGLPVDGQGNPYIYLVSGDTIQCTYATAVTAAKAVNVAIYAADF